MNVSFERFLKEVNTPWLMENSQKLMDLELGQTFEHYRAAAQFTSKLIKEAGLENCEIIEFPADGKTVYQDKRMPFAWRAGVGKLTIEKSPITFDDPVVADYKRHPFHLVKGSVATPSGGLNVRIITEDQMFAGQDARGCIIMLNPFTRPCAKILTPALERGAIGLVSDYLVGRYDTPLGIQWVTACTEGSNWHVQVDDRPFTCFSVTPENGDRIRAAVVAGEVIAHVECDGVRYEGVLPAVTVLIPGRQKKELWIISHLYEPMIDDNSSGVVGTIEMARIIKKLVDSSEIPPLEFSLRLVFTMELYGFAAFAEKMRREGGHKAIGAINTDSFIADKVKIWLAPPATPFFGNCLMEKLVDEYNGQANPVILGLVTEGMYKDDMSLSDATVGIPVLWVLKEAKWWHNSAQTIDILSPLCLSRVVAFVGTWAASVLTINSETLPIALAEASIYAVKHLLDESKRILNNYASGEMRIASDITGEIRERMNYLMKLELERLVDFRDICDSPVIDGQIKRITTAAQDIITDIEKQIKDIPPCSANIKNDEGFDNAAYIVPGRATVGFPYDLVAVPKAERKPLPEGMLYGAFARVLANMDGRKNLQRLTREAEWESGKVFSCEQLKSYVTAISYLTDCGYLKTEYGNKCNGKEI